MNSKLGHSATMINTATNSPEETRKLGETIGTLCKGGETFLMDGDLGAGKTCFTQGLALGLDIHSEVTSPTFVLHTQYIGPRLQLNHIDAYRLEDAPDIGGLGFDDYIGTPQSVAVIEWPQFIDKILPKGCITVEITNEGGNNRRFDFSATATPGINFIKKLIDKL